MDATTAPAGPRARCSPHGNLPDQDAAGLRRRVTRLRTEISFIVSQRAHGGPEREDELAVLLRAPAPEKKEEKQ